MAFSASSSRALAFAAILIQVGIVAMAHDTAYAQNAPADPWTSAQVTQPSELAALLSNGSGAQPIILQVGFQVLYKSMHIPGAIYAGPASTPEGLQAFKQAVAKFPKNSEIYIYCGCCPIQKCPNIRPAVQALKAMHYTHFHVVMLPTSFGKDWVAHGYPVAGESSQ